MHPRERVLELARLCEMRGCVFPSDLLAQAEELGIILTAVGQPRNHTITDYQQPTETIGELDGF
jgi:hypothetical protein